VVPWMQLTIPDFKTVHEELLVELGSSFVREDPVRVPAPVTRVVTVIAVAAILTSFMQV
jgi:hypothetical protein